LKRHVVLEGSHMTRKAQTYPARLCKDLAFILCDKSRMRLSCIQ